MDLTTLSIESLMELEADLRHVALERGQAWRDCAERRLSSMRNGVYLPASEDEKAFQIAKDFAFDRWLVASHEVSRRLGVDC